MYLDINYQCRRCGIFFIPYSHNVECPNCGFLGEETFDITEPILEIMKLDSDLFNRFCVPAWEPKTPADQIVFGALAILDELIQRITPGPVTFSQINCLSGYDSHYCNHQYMAYYLWGLAQTLFSAHFGYQMPWYLVIEEPDNQDDPIPENLIWYSENPLVDQTPLMLDPDTIEENMIEQYSEEWDRLQDEDPW